MYWMRLFLPALLLATVIASCEQVSYTPYDTSLSEEYQDLTRKNIERLLENSEGDEELRIALVGDPQRQLDTSEDLILALNKQKDIDLVVVLGDLTNYGLRREYEDFIDVYDQLNAPWLTVIGNHDLLGKGEYVYARAFGEMNYVVDYNDIRLVFFNSNGLHNEDAAPNFPWLQKRISAEDGDFAQAVVMSHAPVTSKWVARSLADRETTERYFTESLLSSGKVHVTFHGHWHRYEEIELGNEEILSIVVDNPDDRNFVLATITSDGYQTERVHY